MNKKASESQKKNQPLPEPEYFDELFPALEEMPDPWSEDSSAKVKNVSSPDQDRAQETAGRKAILSPPQPTGRQQPTEEKEREYKGQQGETTETPAAGLREKAALPAKKPAGKALPHSAKGRNSLSSPFDRQTPAGTRISKRKKPADPPDPVAAPNLLLPVPRSRLENRPARIGVRPAVRESEDPAIDGHSAPKTNPADSLDWPADHKAAETPPSSAKPQWYILEEVIQAHQPLPENAIILGVGDDGRPLVLSFEEPSQGGILILGDSPRDNRKHLQAMLSSVARLSKKGQIRIDVVSTETANFKALDGAGGKVCEPESDSVYALLGDILDTLEKRGHRRTALPIRILVLDQLETLVGNLARESLSYLRWILRRGPQAGIWPIATLSTEHLADFDLKTFRSFGLRLCGKIADPQIAGRYSNISAQILKKLLPGSEACLKVEEDVIQFSIPHF